MGIRESLDRIGGVDGVTDWDKGKLGSQITVGGVDGVTDWDKGTFGLAGSTG